MLKEKAYAKVNLFLNVIDKRIDGYHDLEMVMASVELFDLLTFELTPNKEIVVKSDTFITENQEDNLCYKVAKYLQEQFSIRQGVIITIKKEIPIAAGLAGGSADAAATLRGLNKLWKIGLNLDDLAKIGSNFGSDIPFCIYNRLCIARGRGEELVFLDKKLNLPILLINPNIKISTKDVFDDVKKENLVSKKISEMSNAIYNKNCQLVYKSMYNYLENIVFSKEPIIEEIKQQLIELNIEGALMSGSGATVFGVSKDKNKLKKAYEMFNDQYFKRLTKIR